MSETYTNTVSVRRMQLSGAEIKVFDPRDPASGSGSAELSDACVVDRRTYTGCTWQVSPTGTEQLRQSASLIPKAPLSAQGWMLTRDPAGELEPLAGHNMSSSWDGKGGRHCPSYVRGWDPRAEAWVERIDHAGASENLWGPYTIGFLQWDGVQWVDQAEPAFVANEEWEHGSVYEPNLAYHEGRWEDVVRRRIQP